MTRELQAQPTLCISLITLHAQLASRSSKCRCSGKLQLMWHRTNLLNLAAGVVYINLFSLQCDLQSLS